MELAWAVSYLILKVCFMLFIMGCCLLLYVLVRSFTDRSIIKGRVIQFVVGTIFIIPHLLLFYDEIISTTPADPFYLERYYERIQNYGLRYFVAALFLCAVGIILSVRKSRYWRLYIPSTVIFTLAVCLGFGQLPHVQSALNWRSIQLRLTEPNLRFRSLARSGESLTLPDQDGHSTYLVKSLALAEILTMEGKHDEARERRRQLLPNIGEVITLNLIGSFLEDPELKDTTLNAALDPAKALNTEQLYRLFVTLEKYGDAAKVDLVSNKLLNDPFFHTDYCQEIAQYYHDQGMGSRAAEVAKRCLDQSLVCKTRVITQMSKFITDQEALDKIEKRLVQCFKGAYAGDFAIDLADFYFRQGKMDEVDRVLEKSYQAHPGLYIGIKFAEYYREIKRSQKIEQMLDKAVEIETMESHLLPIVALFYAEIGKVQKAKDFLINKSKTETSPGYLVGAAEVLEKLGDVENAIALVELALDELPDSDDLCRVMSLYMRHGQQGKIEAIIEEKVPLPGEKLETFIYSLSPDYFMWVANYYLEINKPKEAEETLNKYYINQSGISSIDLAMFYIKLNKPDVASKYIDNFHRNQPDLPCSWAEAVAGLYIQLGKTERAIREIVKSNCDNKQQTIGLLYKKDKKYLNISE